MPVTLLENESVICTLQKSKMIYYPLLLWIILFLFAKGFHNANPNGMGGFFMFIFTIAFFIDFISIKRYKGYITNKRIIRHSGVFLREDEVKLEQIESISVERFKYILWHQVFFRGSGGIELMFDYVKNHSEFKNAVYDAKEKNNQQNQTEYIYFTLQKYFISYICIL